VRCCWETTTWKAVYPPYDRADKGEFRHGKNTGTTHGSSAGAHYGFFNDLIGSDNQRLDVSASIPTAATPSLWTKTTARVVHKQQKVVLQLSAEPTKRVPRWASAAPCGTRRPPSLARP
jgi:hypothetical protein